MTGLWHEPGGVTPGLAHQPAVPTTGPEKQRARAARQVAAAEQALVLPNPPLPPKTIRPATQSPQVLLVGKSRASTLKQRG